MNKGRAIKADTLREDFARAVHDYLLIEQTALLPADCGLIFGNKHIIEPLARTAAHLYHHGYFPRIVASGGVQVDAHHTEASALRRAMMQQGVADSDILLETQSTHTGENVLMSRALLEQHGLARDMTTVIGIGHIVAARRFLMTLERHWPGLHKMHVSANPYGTAPKDWHLHPHFRTHVMQEWRKIAPYLAADKIREVDMDHLNRVTSSLRAIRGLGPGKPLTQPNSKAAAASGPNSGLNSGARPDLRGPDGL